MNTTTWNGEECFKPTLENFPRSLFTNQLRTSGVIAMHIIVSLYMFAVVALIVHAYVVSAIKTLADDFRIASEASRNTLVGAGQLLPEFFCSLIGVFVSRTNIGAATVIGSCAANSLLTLGVVGLITTAPVKLSWYPLWRDNIFYAVLVTVFLWVTFDHEMKWQECTFLFAIYLIYLLFINFDHKVERGVRRIVLIYRTGDDELEEEDRKPLNASTTSAKVQYRRQSSIHDIPEENSDDLSDGGHISFPEDDDALQTDGDIYPEHDRISLCTEDGYLSPCGYTSEGGYLSERGYYSEQNYGSINQPATDHKEPGYLSDGDPLKYNDSRYTTTSRFARQSTYLNRRVRRKRKQGSYYLSLNMDEYVDGPRSPFHLPQTWYMRIGWVLSIPAVCVFQITIPDCRKPEWRKWYPCTLIMSSLWIGLLSYALVWIAAIIGYTWKVPDSVMGFAFLATGLSFSEIVSSYMASQAGEGSKVVYGIYGSNVFNISVSLGFVWLLKCIEKNPYVIDNGSIVYINLCQLLIVFTPLFLQFTRWRLNKVLAVVYLLLYCTFTSIVILLEYDIIGHFNPPVCDF